VADEGDRKGNYQIPNHPTTLVAMINKEISGTEITEKNPKHHQHNKAVTHSRLNHRQTSRKLTI